MKLVTRKDYRTRRHARIRRKVVGTAERPRLSVMVSSRHMYVQVVDDASGRTLAAVSTHGTEGANNVGKATEVGRRIAEAAVAVGVRSVVLDRGGFRFHGRVKAIADAARAAGLQL